MEVSNLVVLPAVLAFSVLCLHFMRRMVRLRNLNLPPGRLGWPVVGETFEFMHAMVEGNVLRFLQERVEKYDSRVFKTSMFGNPVVVFCGPAGNKFLFSNENKNVQVWWPSSVRKLLRLSLVTKVGDEAKMVRKLLMNFLNAETLRNYLPKMDRIAQHHIDTYWKGNIIPQLFVCLVIYISELCCQRFTHQIVK